jgi:hypothetical protein
MICLADELLELAAALVWSLIKALLLALELLSEEELALLEIE